jgi:hypothetical protein
MTDVTPFEAYAKIQAAQLLLQQQQQVENDSDDDQQAAAARANNGRIANDDATAALGYRIESQSKRAAP